jgi:hypothetical protein
MNIDNAADGLLAECWKAAIDAYYYLETDPTDGATYYLNPETVMAVSGKLPDWWDIDADPATERVIGRHAFRKAAVRV